MEPTCDIRNEVSLLQATGALFGLLESVLLPGVTVWTVREDGHLTNKLRISFDHLDGTTYTLTLER